MPTSPSAKKSLRVSQRRTLINVKKKKRIKETKRAAMDNPTPENISAAYKAIDKAQKTGYLKKSAAARKKSRLAKAAAKKATK